MCSRNMQVERRFAEIIRAAPEYPTIWVIVYLIGIQLSILGL